MKRIWLMTLSIILLQVQVRVAICDSINNRTYVTTPLGKVQGYFELSWKNRSYKSFTGIPYAQAPIGKLRFEPPVPLTKWEKTIDATVPPSICPRYNGDTSVVDGEEDCLYLNIYVPVVNRNENIIFPVLFWIHGGGFQVESSSEYKAKYVMDRNMIFVTPNYRLGALGFLSTGDHVIPGNMGLKDQSLALRWVSENIEYFGGDPNRVTLAGDSAGAASVHYHYLSPMSAGLFQNGISLSGSALDPWALTSNSSHTVQTYASVLNCPVDNSTIISECLKTKSVMEIIQGTEDISKSVCSFRLIFLPVSENVQTDYFINKPPIDIIKSGKISKVPWITGFVQLEGLLMTSGIYANDQLPAYVNENWITAGGELLYFEHNIPRHRWDDLLNLARNHYLGKEPIGTDEDSLSRLTRLVGDYIMSINGQRAARLHAEVTGNPAYFYSYTYSSPMSIYGINPKTGRNFGVAHDDDAAFVFEIKGLNPTTTESDSAMLEMVLDNWYSIVATRKPNVGVPWLDVGSSEDFQYMNIAGPGNNKMITDNNLSEIQFWTSIGL